METMDTVILGAGAAGLFCAGAILQAKGMAGHRVLVLDHADAPGEKIRISGGGRCNFTNLASAPELPDRPTMALSALGPAPDRDSFAAMLAQAFAAECERWRRYGLEPLLARWQSVAHPVGTPLTVQEPGASPVQGTFAGLTADGALQLRLEDGSIRAVHAGDVFA